MQNDTINIPDVECLYCHIKGTCITHPEYIEEKEGIITRSIVCLKCRRRWKDFYGATNEDSPVLSIQRNTDSN